MCTRDSLMWRCETFLICWEVVEAHLPSRVMRQFSFFQPIPCNVLMAPDIHTKLHSMRRGGKKNWETRHARYIEHWDDRHNHIVVGHHTNEIMASEEYMNWYRERTVVHIVHPTRLQSTGFANTGGRQDLLLEALATVNREHASMPPPNMAYETSRRYLEEFGEMHRSQFDSVHFSAEHNQHPGPPPPPVQRDNRQRRRQPSQTQAEASSSVQQSNRYEADDSDCYRVVVPLTFAEAPSTFYEDRQIDIDLNTTFRCEEILDNMEGPTPSQYRTPSTNFSNDAVTSPPFLHQGMRDTFGLHSRNQLTPINFSNDIMLTPESLASQQSLMHTHELEELMNIEQQQPSWGLARNRERRPVVPRRPCLTSDRCYQNTQHGHGPN